MFCVYCVLCVLCVCCVVFGSVIQILQHTSPTHNTRPQHHTHTHITHTQYTTHDTPQHTTHNTLHTQRTTHNNPYNTHAKHTQNVKCVNFTKTCRSLNYNTRKAWPSFLKPNISQMTKSLHTIIPTITSLFFFKNANSCEATQALLIYATHIRERAFEYIAKQNVLKKDNTENAQKFKKRMTQPNQKFKLQNDAFVTNWCPKFDH